jgi:hypothetical protein
MAPEVTGAYSLGIHPVLNFLSVISFQADVKDGAEMAPHR